MEEPLSTILTDQSVSSASTPSFASRPARRTLFVHLVFDTILLEKASNHRTNQSAAAPTGSDYVFVSLKELEKAFKIVQKKCSENSKGNPKHYQSVTMTAQLERFGLSEEANLRTYIQGHAGASGIFLPSPSQQNEDLQNENKQQPRKRLPYLRIVAKEGLSGVEVPKVDAAGIKKFEDVYATIPTSWQETISKIVYKLREELWDRPVQITELGSIPYSVALYGAYSFKSKQEKSRSNPTELDGSAHLAAIKSQLEGLQIKAEKTKATYGLQGPMALPIIEPTGDAYQTLSIAMNSLYQRLQPSQEYLRKRSRLIKKLQSILDAAFPTDSLRLEVFGSCASGLGSETSDADLCITSDFFQKSRPYNDMGNLATVLRRGGMIKVKPITGARVPIVKFVDPDSRINCDINTNRVLGVYNSELIRCYTMIDDRVKPLLYTIKDLVKRHRINDSSQSWLSSYAYVMMAIGFLQAQDPPILPSLQAQPAECMMPLHVIEEDRRGKAVYDCTFDHEFSRHQNFGAKNTKPVGQLLIEFFEFYTRYFDYQTMEVNVRLGGVRVRDEITRRKMMPLPGKGEKRLIVMDPFIRDRNVAKTCTGRHLIRVWTVFERIYLILCRGEFQKAFQYIPESSQGEETYATSGRRVKIAEVTTVTTSVSNRPRDKRIESKYGKVFQRSITKNNDIPAAPLASQSQQGRPIQANGAVNNRASAISPALHGPLPTAHNSTIHESQNSNANNNGSENLMSDNQTKSMKRRNRKAVAAKAHQHDDEKSGLRAVTNPASLGHQGQHQKNAPGAAPPSWRSYKQQQQQKQ
ncbi:hypothetical protein BX616_008866 [Lobosporangium transversale]|uniref:polynucleotide adenylyltransferase n=1 Tax=Lobosporangium transversale TaxID=64571 RepID=A0A1Y2GYV6_9FUNG|nr:hypothetical protein BCR41DRAFT_346869 [Lobosporangium transversale]KAF9918426.1 hypothetical protein BX616_008866 [Lobosporangium transversale]ORZ27490.1 hypothetical protein BCR41DRAFT_346869 [Lobosporangium transversale]|eukprot:XP_021885217.1 hypothetical protein BCR41DRAFT_346869 [Lobosporangium transversale]